MIEKRISEKVIGCAYEVSNILGVGFLEAVYERALCTELRRQGIAFERQKPLPVSYKGEEIGVYVADLVVEESLLVELKAAARMSPEHEAQVLNYLKASKLAVGLLLNFGTPKLGIRRLVWRYQDQACV